MTRPGAIDRKSPPAAPPAAPPATGAGRPAPTESTFGTFERGYYAGPARSATTVDAAARDHLLGRLDEKPCAILSLAVFDTLLLRDARGEPRRVWEIAERWRDELPAGSRGLETLDLYLARRRAAELAGVTPQPRLDHLLGVMLALLRLPRDLAPRLAAVELAYEAETLAPNPLILAVREFHAARDGQVVLLSDSALTGEQIHELLGKLGLPGVAAHAYTSAETGAAKQAGAIFTALARKHRASPEEVLHIGDDFHADYAMPRRAGWAAQHLPVPLCEARARQDDARAFLDDLDGAGL